MKKTFLARRNTLISSTGISWGAWALFCALIVFLLRLVAPNFFWHVFTPIYNIGDTFAAGSHTFFSSFEHTATLAAENEKLREENTILTNENKALTQKNAAVTLLGDSGIIAGVVARPLESPYDTLVLAAGKNAGVTLGQEAFGAGGVPLGVISSVLADFSRVMLFSAPGVTTNGWVGNNAVPLTLQGTGAGTFQATVARAANISVGDEIFVPGPGALPIGKVTRIDSNPSAPSETLRITPALNIFSITWVIVRDVGTVPL